MQLNKDVFVKCEECEHEFSFWGSELDFEVVSSSERGMGEEVEYGAEGNYECSECGNEITISVSYWEYPAGAYNHHEESISGGELLSNIIKL
jgi:DNA-directed RNA polymerase subunit RPC12/RpoP